MTNSSKFANKNTLTYISQDGTFSTFFTMGHGILLKSLEWGEYNVPFRPTLAVTL